MSGQNLNSAQQRTSRVNTIKALVNQTQAKPVGRARLYTSSQLFSEEKPKTFDEIKNEREQIINQGIRADQKLKNRALKNLFWFLGIETGLVFVIAIVQGFGGMFGFKFALEEWSFRLLIGGTITQTVTMLTIAIQHLFPKRDSLNS